MVGFRKTEHAQDQQNSIAYGQNNRLTVASIRFISFQRAYVDKMEYFINKSVILFTVAI